MSQLAFVRDAETAARRASELQILRELERKILWLSAWIIHNANHLRPSQDGLKVGGHQASCASLTTLLTALYFKVLRPEDRVAVKPHASPVLHAIEYLCGNQSLEQLRRFRALGGAQSYPSRTKDVIDIDFSTGSVGLGVAATLFASIVQDYVGAHFNAAQPGRMIALLGDAELDEGNVYEALLEGWKHDVRNLWWIVDYNRQSLDGAVNDALFHKITAFFRTVDWDVLTLKYGKKLCAAREGPAGEALIDWIDQCPNQLYSALTYQGGASWRKQLTVDLSGVSGSRQLLDETDDDALHALMTNLGGHDFETILDAFDAAANERPTCFVAYTIKGHGLPFAGHKDNHAGLMNPSQMAQFARSFGAGDGEEWEKFSGFSDPVATSAFVERATTRRRRVQAALKEKIPVPEIAAPKGERLSTQEAFGKILFGLARETTPLSQRIVTASPDVTVSTNLAGWVNRRGIFHTEERGDLFQDEKIASPNKWRMAPSGQHIELGIAEQNLFLLLGQLGLADSFWNERLLPIGTVYDPFINRGLDALIYACYQGARFMIVATPSGITLAPEGGAHQSIGTPLIGMSQPGLSYFEPAYADELAVIMEWGFRHMQAEDGGSLYLRLSTRLIDQLPRTLNATTGRSIVEGGYWLREPSTSAPLALAYTGAVAQEAMEAVTRLMEDYPGLGVLAVTSPDRLYASWTAAQRSRAEGIHTLSTVERLLGRLAADASIVTVVDGHPLTLAWLGAVQRHRIHALGVDDFGQSGSIPELFKHHRLDTDAIARAAHEIVTRPRSRSP